MTAEPREPGTSLKLSLRRSHDGSPAGTGHPSRRASARRARPRARNFASSSGVGATIPRIVARASRASWRAFAAKSTQLAAAAVVAVVLGCGPTVDVVVDDSPFGTSVSLSGPSDPPQPASVTTSITVPRTVRTVLGIRALVVESSDPRRPSRVSHLSLPRRGCLSVTYPECQTFVRSTGLSSSALRRLQWNEIGQDARATVRRSGTPRVLPTQTRRLPAPGRYRDVTQRAAISGVVTRHTNRRRSSR